MAPATNGRLQLASFARVVPLLPPWLRTVAVDLRGHGDADEPPSGYGLASPAVDVVAAMDALDVLSAVLVGSSSGGHVAQRVAVDAPRRVAGLVLAGAPRDLRGRPPLADEVAALTDPVDRAWARRFVALSPTPRQCPGGYLEQRVADALRLPAATRSAASAGTTTGCSTSGRQRRWSPPCTGPAGCAIRTPGMPCSGNSRTGSPRTSPASWRRSPRVAPSRPWGRKPP